MSSPTGAPMETLRTIARQKPQRGDLDAAEKSFLSLLERQPQDVKALRFVANRQYAPSWTDAGSGRCAQAPSHRPGRC
ncbi:MAG TPA: hypothetical protein VNE18_06575 [Rhodanobacter sp.]|nr:hypothetical protein [Rhodanobacter sp.]